MLYEVITPLGVSIFRTSEATMLEERNFFGVKRVYDAEKNGMKFHVLSNGSTRHGIQNLTYGEEKIPLSYYSFASPVGDFLMKNGSLSDGRITSYNVCYTKLLRFLLL